MIDEKNNAPRRYFADAQGHRVLIGLSLEETAEFEALDLSALPDRGTSLGDSMSYGVAGPDEIRWLELYSKHERAWRTWIAQSRAARGEDSGFVNYV